MFVPTRRSAARLMVGLFAYLTLPPVSARADAGTYRVHNGYWWREILDDNKLGYIAGFLDGTQFASDIFQQIQKTASQKMAKLEFERAVGICDFSEMHFGQFVEGLDSFYKDYRNLTIHSDDALSYVRDQIAGKSPESLNIKLDALRKLATSSSYEK